MEVIFASTRRSSGCAQLLLKAGPDSQRADSDIEKLTYRVVAAAWALSSETWAVWTSPGDPVEFAGGEQSTLCSDCRGPAAKVLPRESRTRLDTAPRAYPSLEELVGAEDLAALMDATHAPAEHRGWPVRSASG